MIQVRVAALVVDTTGQHVMLLKPLLDADRAGAVVPIWIGELEATSILVAIEDVEMPRPFAHDLMRNLLASVDAEVERVEVTRLEEGTYFAEVTLSTPSGVRRVDARPSDAVALASRAGASIWVAESVLEEAGVP
ncbi:bifunctional nuclease family protein, partial [Schumannella luteola]